MSELLCLRAGSVPKKLLAAALFLAVLTFKNPCVAEPFAWDSDSQEQESGGLLVAEADRLISAINEAAIVTGRNTDPTGTARQKAFYPVPLGRSHWALLNAYLSTIPASATPIPEGCTLTPGIHFWPIYTQVSSAKAKGG